MNRKAGFALSVVALAFGSGAATAAESDICAERTGERVRVVGEGSSDLCLLLGGGVLGGESEFTEEEQSSSFPVVYLTYGQFSWDTTEVGYYLLGNEGASGYWGLAARLELPSDGFKVDDEQHLTDLDDRDPALEGGLTLKAGGGWGVFEIGANADLEGEHDGYSVQTGYEFPVRLDQLTFSPGVFATYRDEKNGDYYYGVDADETGVERPAYEVEEATVSVGFGYSLTYRIGTDWSLFHSLQVRALDDLLDDSPLTVTGEPGALSAGVLYRIY